MKAFCRPHFAREVLGSRASGDLADLARRAGFGREPRAFPALGVDDEQVLRGERGAGAEPSFRVVGQASPVEDDLVVAADRVAVEERNFFEGA